MNILKIKSDNNFLQHLGANVKGRASGWGVLNPDVNPRVPSKTLQMVNVQTISNSQCEAFYQHDGSVTDSMMCAKSDSGGGN